MANDVRLNGQQKAACLMLALNEEQAAMVSAAKDLSDRGEIVIAAGGGEDELVY